MRYKVKIEQIIDVYLDNETPLTDRTMIKKFLKNDDIPYLCVGGGGYEEVRGKDYSVNYSYKTRNKIDVKSIKKK